MSANLKTAENLSAREIAEREIADESRKQNVARFKEILSQIEKAKLVVKNLERELEDLEHELGA